LVSPESTVTGVAEPNRLHGHVGPALGVTGFDGVEAELVPTALVAVTVNVYAVPLVSPLIVTDVAGGLPETVVAVCAVVPTNGVTVYVVIGLPPLTGADHDTVADALLASAVTDDGAPGGPCGVTEPDGADAGPAPTAFVAVTVNVYVVPLASPLIVADVALPATVVGVCAVVPTNGVMA
jgi:hypothetical protein